MSKSFIGKLIALGFKLGLVLAVIFAILCAYYYVVISSSSLDAEQKWKTPAVVYSRPLELTVEQKITFDQLEHELTLLKYRKVSNPANPGEYGTSRNKEHMVIIRRPFNFSYGPEESRPIHIVFKNSRISSISDAATGENIDIIQLDPVLLERLSSSGEEDRLLISIDDVPQKLIDTLIYVEDRDFYSHHGISIKGILRAIFVNIRAGRKVQGGSTISQQLVKNYFLSSNKTLDRKVRELFMSIIVDARYEKSQILEMYLNEIYLGHSNKDIYGFGLASYFYFGIPVSELDWHQVALLVGMVKGPSQYDPRRHPEAALKRRNLVLSLMKQAGKLTDKQYEYYVAKPLGIVDKDKNFSIIKVPGYISILKDELKKKLGDDYLDSNGLVIFTSLDPQVQLAANTAVKEELGRLNAKRTKKLESAVVVSNWRTGDILAVVGSSDPQFQGMNRVTKARRQVGSLVKPAAYLTAFSNGWHLGSMVHDAPVTVKMRNGQNWSPKNFSGTYSGWIPLYQGFAKSLNVPMVRVGMNVGVQKVVDTIHRLGIEQEIDAVPSTLLGSFALTPIEVNQMYATIATEGAYRQLSAIRVVRRGSDIIYDRESQADKVQVLDPRDAYLTIYGMTNVTSFGTARSLKKYNAVIAGKTGTSNDGIDSWFSGFDNDELVTVWVGNDDNTKTNLTGATGALPVYDRFLSIRGVHSLVTAIPEGIADAYFSLEGADSYIMDPETCTDVSRFVLLPVREDMINEEEVRYCNTEKESDDRMGDFIRSLF